MCVVKLRTKSYNKITVIEKMACAVCHAMFFGWFVLFWFKFSCCRFMLGPAISNSDKPIATILHMTHACCQGIRMFCLAHQKMNYDKMKLFSCWKCEWKSSDEMGPRTLRQPNRRKVDLPWKYKVQGSRCLYNARNMFNQDTIQNKTTHTYTHKTA